MPTQRPDRRTTRFALMALLTASGVLHMAVPGPYRRIVPDFVGHADFVVAASGVAELALAAALALPRTRRLGGYATALLFVAVFPANVKMAIDAGTPHQLASGATAAWVRLPFQIPLVWGAVAVARARRDDDAHIIDRDAGAHR